MQFINIFTSRISRLIKVLRRSTSFLLLVIAYSLKVFAVALTTSKAWWTRPFTIFERAANKLYDRLNHQLDGSNGTLSRGYLIELSFRNMRSKSTRTAITIGGMAIGVAFIVFLVSVGYGLQHLVTSRVARLEELSQAEVVPGLSDELALNDEVLARFTNLPTVQEALPLISVVGRASLHESVTDLAVYGVTTAYLTNSAIQPVQGKIFESHEVVSPIEELTVTSEGEVETQADDAPAVLEASFSQEIGPVSFSINPGSWIRVRGGPSTNEQVLGYTRVGEADFTGTAVYGDYFAGYTGPQAGSADQPLAVWIRASFPLWRQSPCSNDAAASAAEQLEYHPNCEAGSYIPMLDSADNPLVMVGFVAQLNLQVLTGLETQLDSAAASTPALSGTGTSAAAGTATGTNIQTSPNYSDGSLELIDMNSVTIEPTEQPKLVELPPGSLRQAVVNRAVLSVLGLEESNAVGQKISLSFVAVGELIEGELERIESVPTQYEIVGVTPEEDTPVIYVPFAELRSLGINRFSQLKIITTSQEVLPQVRATIEAMGYGTVSVVDTVAQIDNLFSTFRLIMGVIGMVALTVAALGMFNTLTVSLLERTREVGLMKAMGMKEREVKELFLTESMIMGFYGGVLGIGLGYLAGKLVSLLLSTISVSHGLGFLDVAAIPLGFVMLVIFLSIMVGIFTGWYPAKRATRISALNALRYE